MRALSFHPDLPGPAIVGLALALGACTAELSSTSGGASGPGLPGAPTGSGGSMGVPDSTSSGGTVAEPPPYQPPTGALRRLTRSQFAMALEDVFGVAVDRTLLDSDNYSGDFAAIGAASVVTSALGAERYLSAVEAAADAVFSDSAKRAQLLGCEPAAADDACMRGFLATVGRRAWRRELETEEVDQLIGVAQTAVTELGSVIEGARWATVAVFSSMHFLYRAELGESDGSAGLRIGGYEMASRLAFLLWNSLPDQALLDDAASGALDTSVGVRAAAERMLSAPPGRRSVGAFAEDFMRLDRVMTQAKDASLFPEYGPVLQGAMVRDMREVWEIVAFDDDASALDLFSTKKVVANAELAQVYGLTAPGLTSDSFQEFSLPEDSPRVGILGKLAFLSQFANQKEGSPTLRGKFLREALLCSPVEPPPGDVALELPEPPADQPLTKRQRLDAHITQADCAVCHSLTDPMGFPFETFDAIGRYRTTDHGLEIDTSGEFEGVTVDDSRQLGEAMSTSPAVADCLVRKVYSYAVGHKVRDVDATVLEALKDSFTASGYRLKGLLLDIVVGEAFASVGPAVD